MFVGMARDAAKTFGEGLGVTVLASRANLLAPANGVPCSLCPLDFRLQAHGRLLTFCHKNVWTRLVAGHSPTIVLEVAGDNFPITVVDRLAGGIC